MRHCRQLMVIFLTASLIAGSAYADFDQSSGTDRNPVDLRVHEQNPDIYNDTAITVPDTETCLPQSLCSNQQIVIAQMEMDRLPLIGNLHHRIAGPIPDASQVFSPDNPPPDALLSGVGGIGPQVLFAESVTASF